jgi:hypothetical protein
MQDQDFGAFPPPCLAAGGFRQGYRFFATAQNVCFWHKADTTAMSAFGGKADISRTFPNVCF